VRPADHFAARFVFDLVQRDDDAHALKRFDDFLIALVSGHDQIVHHRVQAGIFRIDSISEQMHRSRRRILATDLDAGQEIDAELLRFD
jgi:hypothetical protein